MNQNSHQLTRRSFLGRTLGTGLVLPLDSLLSPLAQREQNAVTRFREPVVIHVSSPAGPPPLGAPVETCVPFPRGQLFHPEALAVFSPNQQPTVSQSRVAMTWPDGSVRWLSLTFEAATGPGDYSLQEGRGLSFPDLLAIEGGGRFVLTAGDLSLKFSASGDGWLDVLAALGTEGQVEPIIKGPSACDLVLTRFDGKVFRASLTGETRKIVIEERGPVRASFRVEGKCRATDGSQLFDFIYRWTVYRGRPEVHLSITWVNTTNAPSEQLRDIRLHLPFDFAPERMVFGCDRGVYDGPYVKDWPIYLLQDDSNHYWAKTLNPDGRVQNLSTGGCNGERCPGWIYVQNARRCLGVWVPNFWEEYPNELYLKEDELSVGLWPERATAHLTTKPLLPSNPFGDGSYAYTKYWPIMPHPYIAFVDAGKGCLDARQGMAKTQEIVLSLWAGRGENLSFEKKWWSKTLQPVRGHLDPAYVAGSKALGPLWPRDPERFPKFEQLFDESFGWLNRHIDHLQCYGKFDYGDFKYMIPATDYMCHPGTKWGYLGEMPREGYWHNNERDPLLGLLLYYYRSGNPAVWERCRIVARHLLDVDICHHPHWGMWTHSYGHCYLSLGEAGAPDHSWLLGSLLWAGASGDPLAWDWVNQLGEGLLQLKIDFPNADARTTSVYLHMMCQFYAYTGQAAYLSATQPPLKALLDLQNPNGSWPAYLGNQERPKLEGFVEHVVMGLADYYAIRQDGEVRKAIDRALVYLFGEKDEKPADPGESTLALYALAVLAEATGQARYAERAANVLDKLHEKLNLFSDPFGRGDLWATWGINNAEMAKATGRPAQFLGQTRPLAPASALAYGQQCLASIARKARA